MKVECSGPIVKIGEHKTGTSSKTGKEWCSQKYVMIDNSVADRECKVEFEVFGQDKIDEFDLKVGENVTVTLFIESKEYKEKYFTNVRCIKCEKEKPQQVEEEPAPAKTDEQVIADITKNAKPAPKQQLKYEDDLPF